jgi:hypothetical protein
MKKNIIFFSLLLLYACSDKSPKNNGKENQIQLKVEGKSGKTQFFKEYFTLETVISIETTDEYLFSDHIKRVISYKEKLIILDSSSSIFVVDSATGKIETCINRIGQGPGESKNIMDICVDEQTETLLVFNDYHKLLFFDLSGNFIREETFKKLYEDIIYDDGNVLFYNQGEGYSCYPYQIDKYNLKHKTLEAIGKNDRLDFPMRLYGRHIVKSKNIWFGTPLDFDLSKYSDSKIESVYKLNSTTGSLTKEIMELATSDPGKFLTVKQDNNIMYGIGSIRETEHYLLFISCRSGLFILNKETNEIHWENFVNETSLGLLLLNYFPHDGDDNRIMFFVHPGEWLRRNKDASLNNIPAALKEKIDSFAIEEDSNPILVFYKEKK